MIRISPELVFDAGIALTVMELGMALLLLAGSMFVDSLIRYKRR